MKCVQSIVNAKVKRVTDAMAERMVASKSWSYVPKWKCKGKEPTEADLKWMKPAPTPMDQYADWFEGVQSGGLQTHYD